MAETNVRTSRWKQKTHFTLLTYIVFLVVGSSVWLKLSLTGDHSGGAISRPAWAEGGRGDHLAQITDFTMDVSWDSCVYGETSNGCDPDEASVLVEARVGNVFDNEQGLYLALRASSDFKSWRQANSVELPRELFALRPANFSVKMKETLIDIFEAAEAKQVGPDNLNPNQPQPVAGEVPIFSLVDPTKEVITGTGAITISTAAVVAELARASGPGCEIGNSSEPNDLVNVDPSHSLPGRACCLRHAPHRMSQPDSRHRWCWTVRD